MIDDFINRSDCAFILERAIKGGAGFAELYFEDRDELSIKFNQNVKGITKTHIYGAGLYLISGLQTVYSYTNDTSIESLKSLCDKSVKLLLQKQETKDNPTIPQFILKDIVDPNPVIEFPSSIQYQDKIKLLLEVNKACNGLYNEIINLDLTYFDTDQKVVIVNSRGLLAEDRRVTSRVRLFPTLTSPDDSISYFTDFTRPAGFEVFKDGSYIGYAQKILKDMRENLYADTAPGGVMPVILEGGGCTGTFFHEACGHQFESQTIVNKGIFADKIGTKVASDKVTLIDDGTMPNSYGSSKFDDEGNPRRKNILIENGIMKSYLCDRIGALRLNTECTGSGRRQGYSFSPAARMSNTYLDKGNDDPDEMISSLPSGLFVTKMGGGSGGEEFTLAAQTAFIVKNGKIDKQVKGAMLLGKGVETMQKIDRVGNTLIKEDGGGFCGSISGLLPTTTSGARMRVTEMLIGGKGA